MVFIKREKVFMFGYVRCDSNPNSIHEHVDCGMPAKPENLPIGTKFETVLSIPQ